MIKEKIRNSVLKYMLGNSIQNALGRVTRNYTKAPTFDPTRQAVGVTYKAIDKTGASLSVYEPRVQKIDKGETTTVVNHPLYNLFNNPNPLVNSASDFIHLYGMLYEIYGETFWYKVRGERSNKLKEVYLLDPLKMELKFNDGELIGYVLHKNNGQQVPFMLEEIYHDKRPNPFNERRGISVLERAAVYVETEINVSHFTLNYIRNSGSPSGIVSLPNMEREAFNQFTQQWREEYEGPENAGKTGFIRGGEAKFQAVGSTLKDIDQKITKQMAVDDVLMMLETPRPLLGMTDDKGFGRGNLDALYYIYTKEKIEPLMRRLDRIYENLAQDITGQVTNVIHESPVPEDKEYNLTKYEKGVNVWMTVNEVRKEQGLPPLPGGDEIIPKAPTIQLSAKSATEQAPQTESKIKSAPKETIKIVKKSSTSEETKKISEDAEAFRSKLVDVNEVYVKKLKTKLSSFLSDQEAKIIKNINLSKKSYEEWLFNIKEDSEELAVLLTPILVELMEKQSEDVANFISGELLTISPEVRGATEAHVKEISGVFNKDTIDALEKTISEGQAAGESLPKIKKRVEKVYSDAKGYRAERIARTESLKASNLTAEEVYKQNGYNKVAWFTNPGACEFCKVYDGRTKEIGGTFAKVGEVVTGAEGNQLRIDYDDVPTPPLHPNCTCSLIPVE